MSSSTSWTRVIGLPSGLSGDLVAHLPAHPLGAAVEHFADPGEQFPPVCRLGRKLDRVELECHAGPVVDQDVAIPVEDPAARCRDPHFAGPVLVGLGEVLVTGHDLQRPEPEEKDPEQDQADSADHRDATR